MDNAIVFRCRHRYASGFLLDAKFEAGSGVTALAGPSGSGKTTILSLIAGLVPPQTGFIQLGDTVVTDTEKRVAVRPERRGVGLLFQDHCLFPHLRARANIKFGTRRRPQSKIPLKRVIETLELGDLLDRYPRSLSGGQQQRVALARAIAAGPKLLLLDEPLTSVEAALRDSIAAFISAVVHEFALPTILVSHDMQLVDRLANRILTLEEGKLTEAT